MIQSSDAGWLQSLDSLSESHGFLLSCKVRSFDCVARFVAKRSAPLKVRGRSLRLLLPRLTDKKENFISILLLKLNIIKDQWSAFDGVTESAS